MYNLLEYSGNYSRTSGSSWNYNRDKIYSVDDNASEGKSFKFKYKAKIVRRTYAWPPQFGKPWNTDQSAQSPVPTVNVEVTLPLKYLNNFKRSLNLPLINCEVELDLSQTKNSVLIETNNITGVDCKITTTKLYDPVATLSINNDINL